MPQLDAFTTVFSVVGTWWMIQGDPTNWLYWMVIDAVSIYLYAKRGMPWGALLFALYTLDGGRRMVRRNLLVYGYRMMNFTGMVY